MLDEAAQAQIARIVSIWGSTLARHEGQSGFLFGAFSIADAFYAPVATRLRTYGITLGGAAQAYARAILADAAFLAWEKEALAETWTMPVWDAY